jgi:hypothetical protein
MRLYEIEVRYERKTRYSEGEEGPDIRKIIEFLKVGSDDVEEAIDKVKLMLNHQEAKEISFVSVKKIGNIDLV